MERQQKRRAVQVHYEFESAEAGETQYWLAWPDQAHSEVSTCSLEEKLKYAQIHDQTIAYTVLRQNEKLLLTYKTDVYAPSEEKMLTEARRQFYLRSGELAMVNEQVIELARSVTKQADSDYEHARLLFHYFVDHFKYQYPPASRGAISFLADKSGDCGEYAFLYAACCRTLDIPCRSIVGSWAHGKMQAHVWNEVFIEDKGWLPVDCSMAFIQKTRKFQFMFSSIRTLPWKAYFGKTDGQRIVFSYDADMPLEPEYPSADLDEIPYQIDVPMQVNGKPFYWGAQSLHGRAPYLQPCYVKIDEKNWKDPEFKPKYEGYLGHWKIKEAAAMQFLQYLKPVAMLLVLITWIVVWFNDEPYWKAAQGGFGLLYCLAFIVRQERIWLFSLLSIFFILSLLAGIFP